MNLIVRNLPDDVHRTLKVHAAQTGQTLQKVVKDILTAEASKLSEGKSKKKR